jgi:hypothetical protein
MKDSAGLKPHKDQRIESFAFLLEAASNNSLTNISACVLG